MAAARLSREDLIARLGRVFHAHGYAGASLAAIGAATGLGKGSLYHAFPGGKRAMAEAVLDAAAARFAARILAPLEKDPDALHAVRSMFAALRRDMGEGAGSSLHALLALSSDRDPFRTRIRGFYRSWLEALAGCLARGGVRDAHARQLAGETLATIEGGVVLARGLDEAAVAADLLARQEARLSAILAARRAPPQRTG